MSQLIMFKKVTPAEYPEAYAGFSFRRFNGSDEDKQIWVDICKGSIIGENNDITAYDRCMTNEVGYDEKYVFIVERDGKPVATTSILIWENKVARVHMVAAKPECRGRGAGKYLADIANAAAYESGCETATLSTDVFRVPAVKSYLRGGFRPVIVDDEAEARWEKWLKENRYSDIPAVDKDYNFAKVLCINNELKKVNIGVFGARRGMNLAQAAVLSGKAYIGAVCDRDESTFKNASIYCREDTQYFTDFDEFIESGIDAVILANYFCDHARFAVKALEKGIHVLSETQAAVTMAECVAICRASEKSGAYYMLAENYAYFATIGKIKELYDGKTFGEVIYSEGEYVHPMSAEEYAHYTPDGNHWRAQMPSGYYLTHSLAPLMMATDEIPVAVNARSVYPNDMRMEREGEPVKDAVQIMLCTMSNGSLARITGWAKFGGHGNWYRFACSKGSMETVRGDEDYIRLCYNKWDLPEGAEKESVVKVEFPFDEDKASLCGHAGGDYFATYEFIDCILSKRQPYFNAYRSCAMAATAILGWRSSLHDGKEYKLPDFSNEEERKLYENDNLSPFADENGVITYPRTKFEADKFDI